MELKYIKITSESSPKVMSIIKNSNDHKVGTYGIRIIAAGYTMNAKPIPIV